MKMTIIILALALAACGKSSDQSVSNVSQAVTCSQIYASFPVLYPDGVTRPSKVDQCSDGCDHDTPINDSTMKMSICVQFQTAPL